MRRWMTVLMVAVFCMLPLTVVSAAEHVATGKGASERAALRDAMRSAVEAEVGVHLDSRTRIANYQVLSDKIYTHSEGYIKSYKVLAKDEIGGVHRVTIRADVSGDKISDVTNSLQQRQAVIGMNMEQPRVAVIAVDRSGKEYPTLSSVLITALQQEGFTRLIDISSANAGAKRAALSLTSNRYSVDLGQLAQLRADAPCDYLVRVYVQNDTASLDDILPGLHKAYISCAASLVNTNTGEITWSGTARGESKHWFGNSEAEALEQVADTLAPQLSKAAFNKAANIQQHLQLTIPQARLGTFSEAREKVEALPGVQHVYLRSLARGIYTLDLDFDGTAGDFATVLEQQGYHVTYFAAESVVVE